MAPLSAIFMNSSEGKSHFSQYAQACRWKWQSSLKRSLLLRKFKQFCKTWHFREVIYVFSISVCLCILTRGFAVDYYNSYWLTDHSTARWRHTTAARHRLSTYACVEMNEWSRATWRRSSRPNIRSIAHVRRSITPSILKWISVVFLMINVRA